MLASPVVPWVEAVVTPPIVATLFVDDMPPLEVTLDDDVPLVMLAVGVPVVEFAPDVAEPPAEGVPTESLLAGALDGSEHATAPATSKTPERGAHWISVRRRR